MVSHLCSNDSSVLLRCPTPRRRTRGSYGYCLFPPACRMVPLQASPRSPGSRAWSFQTCMGSTTTQDRPEARDIAPDHVAFRFDDSVSVPIAIFRSSIPSPTVPLFTLRHAPRDAWCKTRGRVVRYPFLVRLFHPLLHAGLSRRSVNYFSRRVASRKNVTELLDVAAEAARSAARQAEGDSPPGSCVL